MARSPTLIAPASTIRIAVVDDHSFAVEGFQVFFEAIPGCRVVFKAVGGQAFMDGFAAAGEVDMVLVDMRMPDVDGVAVLEWMREHHPSVPTLAICFDVTDETILLAMRAGARGFLDKTADGPEFALAVKHLRETGYYQTDLVHQCLLRNPDGRTVEERARAQACASITEAEWKVVQGIAGDDELTSKAVAAQLGISPRTVDNHVHNICDKLGRKTRLGAVMHLMRLKLLK